MARRVPFVWLPGQEHEHGAGFATLRGAPLRREAEGTNRWVLARGLVHAPDARAAELKLTVDGRYRAWLNGLPLGRGPVRSSPRFQRYDHYEASLEKGRNVLALLVHVPGVDLAWYETMKGDWQPVFGDGGIYAELTSGGGVVPIEWRLTESEAWRRDTPRSGWGQDFIEDVDARLLDPEWINRDFDDRDWPLAKPMVSIGDAAALARGFGRVQPFPQLLASSIPNASESTVHPARLLWIKAVEPSPELEIDRRLYGEELLTAPEGLVERPEALLSPDTDGAVVRTGIDHDTALMLEFDPYHAGHPFIELEASGGEVVEVAVAESIPGEFGRGSAGDGLRLEGHLGVSHVFRYTARPGRQRFEKFNWSAVRAMQVVVRSAPQGLRICRVGSIATGYPADCIAEFQCSDPLLNRLWEVGRYTVQQCMHDAWVDCPGREARQWIGDAAVQFDVGALAFGPTIFPLHAQFLRQAAEGQRQDGLVRMFAPGDIGPEALVIPDFTLLWILTAERYHAESGDLATIRELFPAAEKSLGWFERQTGPNSLLVDVPHWHFIEWAHLDRSGESAPINALYAGALGAAASLARSLDRRDLADVLLERRSKVSRALNRRHWNEERGCYVDSVDPVTDEQGLRVSQHANALMLLFDLAPRERQQRVLEAITDEVRLKLTAAPPIVPDSVPFDEASDVVRANSFFAHYVYQGLVRAGAFNWVLRDMRRLYGPMLETGTATLWESFQPSASLCHGFSATPVFQLSRHCLGVTPSSNADPKFVFAPHVGDLEWARGVVPTQHGNIEVSWRREGRMVSATLGYAEGMSISAGEHPGLRLLESRCSSDRAEFVFELID